MEKSFFTLINLTGQSSSSNVPHTHPFNSLMSETTRVSRYQEGKTDLDFTKISHSTNVPYICKYKLWLQKIRGHCSTGIACRVPSISNRCY